MQRGGETWRIQGKRAGEDIQRGSWEKYADVLRWEDRRYKKVENRGIYRG